MAPLSTAHTRSHSLLLLQKLLNLRDGASPLTLVIDTLEQTSQPILGEFIARAKVRRFFGQLLRSMLIKVVDRKVFRDIPLVYNAQETAGCGCLR